MELEEVEIRSDLAKWLGCATFAALSIIGVTGNSLVIFAIFTDPAVQIRNQLSNLAILNLAYTDLMTTSIVCIPAVVSITYDKYPLGPVFCRIWAVFNLIGIIATMGLLMVISVDRFIAVGWSLHYPRWMTYSRMMGAILYVWISSWTTTFGWAFFQCDYDVWAGVCDFTWQLFGPKVLAAFWFGIACTVWFFVVPSSAILFCNISIIRMSKDKGRVGRLEKVPKKMFESRFKLGPSVISGGVNNGTGTTVKHHDSNKVNARILKAMIIVIVSYFVLTFPVALIRVVKVLSGPDGPAKHIPGWLTLLCTFLQFAASIVNPLIYGLFRKDFKDSYARVWNKIFKKS